MFKVGTATSTTSTVNLNGSYKATFKSLINGAQPNAAPTVINVENFAKAILKANGVTDSRAGTLNASTAVGNNTYPMAHRGDIYRVFARYVLDNSIASGTYSAWEDDKIDEFIEKFIELTNVRQNYYMVYATGIATNNVDSVSESNILAAHRIKAIVYRDAWKNTVKVIRKDAVED